MREGRKPLPGVKSRSENGFDISVIFVVIQFVIVSTIVLVQTSLP
jgi:hypothetical protein